jgi:vacuolar protein sorting-associated protein 72
VHRQLTQADLLAEAARTEIDNAKSLQLLVAIEEEHKKRAQVKRGRYVGPMLRLRSFRGEDGEEHTTLEVRNMQTPAELAPRAAPPPPPRAACVITGRPARYRDPQTGLAYADLEAYRELRRRKEAAAAAAAQQAAAAQLQHQQAIQQQMMYAAQQQQQQQQYYAQQQQQYQQLQQPHAPW